MFNEDEMSKYNLEGVTVSVEEYPQIPAFLFQKTGSRMEFHAAG